LKQYGFVYKNKFVILKKKEYARGGGGGVVYVNNCECIEATFTRYIWIRKFMGVNKHNLQSYIYKEDLPVYS
jgi:hypothetical protein